MLENGNHVSCEMKALVTYRCLSDMNHAAIEMQSSLFFFNKIGRHQTESSVPTIFLHLIFSSI